MRKNLVLLAIHLLFFVSVGAQVVSTNPANPTADASTTVTLDVAGTPLANYTGDIYMHTGVTVSVGGLAATWSHVIGLWGDNAIQPKMTALGGTKYQFVFSPSLNSYFSVLPTEDVTQICIVFRSADGALKASANDFFLPVYHPGLNLKIDKPLANTSVVDPNSTIFISAKGFTAESVSLSVDGVSVAQIAGETFTYNLTTAASGRHKMTITARNATGSKSSDLYYFVKPIPNRATLDAGLKMGANYIDDNTVTLVLYAPNKKFVCAIGDYNNWQLDVNTTMNLTPDGNYHWITLHNLEKGREYTYQYSVEGTVNVADPYAAKILDPDNDKYINSKTVVYPNLIEYPVGAQGIVSVLQTAQQPYVWETNNFTRPANKDLNIYELLIRDFTATHNYQSLIDTLPYLKQLGINAIELMPINEFEGNESWGYNPSFYFAPDKYYGPAVDLKRFVDLCHKNKIAVILDQVLNHSFSSSPLVKMYFNDDTKQVTPDNPWYNVVSPNKDYSWGYDFNHESTATQRFVDSVTVYWMNQYKVDGFRFDFAKGFTNTPGNGSAFDQSRINILTRMANKIWANDPSAYVILESFTDNSEEKILANSGMMIWGNLNYAYGQAGMGYDKTDLTWGSYKARGYSKPNLVTYMESHDEEREAYRISKFGNSLTTSYQIKGSLINMIARLELNSAFFFSIPGPKMIWQFGEFGYDISIDSSGRVGNKPIKWDYLKIPERLRLMSVYSDWNRLRSLYDVFKTDDFTTSLSSDSVKSIKLHSATLDAVIIGDFDCVSRYAIPVFPSTGKWYEYYTGDSITVTNLNMPIKLTPSEYRMYTNVRLSPSTVFSAPKVTQISVTGKSTVGSVLTGSYTYFDATNDLEGESLKKWYVTFESNGTRPTYRATTGPNYTISSSDIGQFIFYEVTPVAKTGGLLIGSPISKGLQSMVVNALTDAEINKIKAFPNPVIDQLEVTLSEQVTSLRLIDSNGKLLLNRPTKGETQIKIDFTGYAKGAYYILFNAKEGLAKTEKIIK